MSRALAHTGCARSHEHALVVHLRDVAARTRRFAANATLDDQDFAALAAWAGWLHGLVEHQDESPSVVIAHQSSDGTAKSYRLSPVVDQPSVAQLV
jgi:hypothetical protein